MRNQTLDAREVVNDLNFAAIAVAIEARSHEGPAAQ
jgi:hypothetical protein